MQKYAFSDEAVPTISEDFSEIHSNILAFNHRMTSLQNKCMQVFKQQSSQSKKCAIMLFFFEKWKQKTKTNKINRYKVKLALTSMQRFKNEKKKYELMKNVATSLYQYTLKDKYFNEIRFYHQNEMKSLELKKMLTLKYLQEFKKITDSTHVSNSSKKVLDQIYFQNLLKKSLIAFRQNTFSEKIIKKRRKNRFPEVISRIKRYNREQFNICKTFRQKILKKTAFKSIKYWKILMNYQKNREKNVLKKSFEGWKKIIYALFYEKEKEHGQQELAEMFYEQKLQIFRNKIYEHWKKWFIKRKEERKNKKIFNEYIAIKEKESLLKKYFTNWKKLKKVNMAVKFHSLKLKEKTLESLKIYNIKSAQQWERVLNFVERRERLKYFRAIQLFNQIEKEKIRNFLQKKTFTQFSICLVQNYVFQNQKADNHRMKILSKKVFKGLKKQVMHSKKYSFCVAYLNAILPLKRWRKQSKIRRFMKEREMLMKAKIMMELKLKMNEKYYGMSYDDRATEEDEMTEINILSLDYSLTREDFQRMK